MGKGVLVAAVVVFFLCATVISQGDTKVVNINTATESELDELPGIGPARARAIVSHRTTYGPFQAKEDITQVYGIGQGIFSGIRDMITVGDEGAEPSEVRKKPKPAKKAPPRKTTTKKAAPKKRVSTKTVTTTTKKAPMSDSQQVYYGGKKYIPRGCWNCKEAFFVPDNLKDGWCPFCGKKWSVR